MQDTMLPPVIVVSLLALAGPLPATQAPDACTLLTEDQVSAAIEAKTQPGQHLVASSSKECIWSDDPKQTIDHRRVTLTYSAPISFDLGKQVSKPSFEPVSGVGDGAYYEFFGSEAPMLVVKRGGTVFSIRVSNGLKLKAIPMAALKAKELDLAKAAVTKLP
jgi:hypothetical protein